jgi:iron-sulfur cluster insertion protein
MTHVASPFPVQLTDAARERLAGVVAEERVPHLRVFVQGGGCAGFSYGFMLEHEAQEDDLVLNEQGFNVFVDPFTAPLLQGATLDWEESIRGSQFVIRNPNAVTTCGCGSSFAL